MSRVRVRQQRALRIGLFDSNDLFWRTSLSDSTPITTGITDWDSPWIRRFMNETLALRARILLNPEKLKRVLTFRKYLLSRDNLAVVSIGHKVKHIAKLSFSFLFRL